MQAGLVVVAAAALLLMGGGERKAWAGPRPEALQRISLSKLAAHPRLWVSAQGRGGAPTPAALKRRAENPEAARFWSEIAGSDRIEHLALVYLLTGDRNAFEQAVGKFEKTTSSDLLSREALAFDWVYEGLNEGERKRIAGLLLESAEEMQGRGYASLRHQWHNIPCRYTAAMCVAALAAADEFPERAQACFDWGWEYQRENYLSAGDYDARPDALNPRYPLLGGGWPEGHDYDRHSSLPSVWLWLALRTATRINPVSGSRYLDQKFLWHWYALLPTERYILPVADTDWPHTIPSHHDLNVMAMSAAGEGPHAPFVRHYVWEWPTSGWSALTGFVFCGPEAPRRDPRELPTDYFAAGVGTATFRSAWGKDASFVAVQATDFFTYHQQNQNGAFYLYRNAPLAWRSGVYDGDVYDHNVNYTVRSIAANCILVFDPEEQYRVADRQTQANDGGQVIGNWGPRPNTFAELDALRADPENHVDRATWLAYESGDNYGYAAFEYGRSYATGKVPEAIRQLVFVKPDWVVVMDRVRSGKPEFQKTFVVHAPEEMEVDPAAGLTTVVTRGEIGAVAAGKLFCKTLLPRGAELARVGGPEARFLVEGRSREPHRVAEEQLPGVYRLEVRAPQEETTVFLHAFYLCPSVETAAMPAVELVADDEGHVTVSLEGGAQVLRFATAGPAEWEWVKGGERRVQAGG
jgi:hypothetical protein